MEFIYVTQRKYFHIKKQLVSGIFLLIYLYIATSFNNKTPKQSIIFLPVQHVGNHYK